MDEYLALWMFPILLLFILSGYPVAFVLSGTGLLFALIGHWLGVFYLSDIGFLPMRIFGVMQNITLMAVPLFVMMGLILEKSGIAADLLKSVTQVFSKRRGSLAVAVVIVGAILAASTGIVGATVVTMGVLALPLMQETGFDKRLSAGVICASGTLGQIIPPSIVLVLLGDMMNVDVGSLFMAAILPGILMVFSYILYLTILFKVKPDMAPQISDGAASLSRNELKALCQNLFAPLLLMVLVLGSILFGLASPTEAAACGACGALLTALIRKRLSWEKLLYISKETASITAMVFFILVGAQFFAVVFRGLGGDEIITTFAGETQGGQFWVLGFLMVLFFLLGFFLDFIEICFIVIPIILPIIHQYQFDPLWFAVLLAINLQTSFLTPPFGFALFYLKGVAPKSISTADIYRGATPFVLIQLVILFIFILFPDIVTFLPQWLSSS